MIIITTNDKYIAFTILIGGKSSRFGSDKGLYRYNGKSLISYQIETLSLLNLDIFLVAHSPKQVQSYLDTINYHKISGFILDQQREFKSKDLRSPMLGLYSAFLELDKIGYCKTFSISCDTPLINRAVITLMIDESKDFDCVIPKWSNDYLEPLFAIYPVQKALSQAKINLKSRKFKLVNLLNPEWNIKYISVENSIQKYDKNLSSFININKNIDLELLESFF
ncbi:MAG: NTP transferase domain-containing protein [Candidatus Lokiarchaeota archaeon]|nr:NTP transferase domain-containing protein [Candidatus Lokiarchaeota archaeon]MBD3202177.1 NTP transferase domain-containing protein [Candidatus Lokiarchaeota archaeon]